MKVEERVERLKKISIQIQLELTELMTNNMEAFERELEGLTDDVIAHVEKATAARIADYVRHNECDELADDIEKGVWKTLPDGRAMTRADLEERIEKVENALISVRDDASSLGCAVLDSMSRGELYSRVRRMEATIQESRKLVPPK